MCNHRITGQCGLGGISLDQAESPRAGQSRSGLTSAVFILPIGLELHSFSKCISTTFENERKKC